jgi:hypothetical protein
METSQLADAPHPQYSQRFKGESARALAIEEPLGSRALHIDFVYFVMHRPSNRRATVRETSGLLEDTARIAFDP